MPSSASSSTNLTALRELGCGGGGRGVDSDLLEHMQGGRHRGAVGGGRAILVCVGPDASASGWCAEAKRLADLADAPWFAVTVERPGTVMDPAGRQKVEAALRLAESWGRKTRSLVGSDIVDEVPAGRQVRECDADRGGPRPSGAAVAPLRAHPGVRWCGRRAAFAVHVVTFGREGEEEPAPASCRRSGGWTASGRRHGGVPGHPSPARC